MPELKSKSELSKLGREAEFLLTSFPKVRNIKKQTMQTVKRENFHTILPTFFAPLTTLHGMTYKHHVKQNIFTVYFHITSHRNIFRPTCVTNDSISFRVIPKAEVSQFRVERKSLKDFNPRFSYKGKRSIEIL